MSLALGITVYEEYVRTGWWLIPQLLGAALIAAGVLALSRLPLARALTTEDTEQPGGDGGGRGDARALTPAA